MPGAAVRAAQIARSAPFGSPPGFATQPWPFGALPRTNATVLPSSEILSCVRSTPSSFRNDVTRTGVNAGPTAVNTLRLPSS